MNFQQKLHYTPILRQTMQDLCRAKRALFAFAQRSGAMKAPVGLLSDRTVLRSKMEGPRPDKFRFDVKFGCVVDECRPTATPRHSGQSWTGCCTINRWSTHSLCCEWRLSTICHWDATTAGWKINDITNTAPLW